MSVKMDFAFTLAKLDLGVMAANVMTDCETYGMAYGCTINCPVLQDGKCELKDTDCKDLYNQMLIEQREAKG